MDESTKNSPCKESDADAAGLHAEVEHLRQHLAERDAHIIALEGEFVNSTTRATELEEQVSTWREKYERLYDSHRRVQTLNQVLEDKLLQMVDKMKGEKSQLTKDIATLSVRLAESKHNYCMLQKENERYKNDMNLAIQLLQCKPDNFVSQKLDNSTETIPQLKQVELIILRLQQNLRFGPFQSKAVMTEDPIEADSSCGSNKQRGCHGSNSGPGEDGGNGRQCRRKCGCMKTSDKLKQILQTSFPNSQPPEAAVNVCQLAKKCDKASGYGYGQVEKKQLKEGCGGAPVKQKLHGEAKSKSWRIVSELVSLVQLSVTATALALYYLIYCYMQLVYYTLRSALYFHNADGPMKITIGVVTLTSLIVAFNILMRMEGIIGIVY